MPQFIGYVVADTDRAILFQAHEWHEPDWMPKSQITAFRDFDTFEMKLEASDWICDQKGLREFEERLPQEQEKPNAF